jgi:hypothetical protein
MHDAPGHWPFGTIGPMTEYSARYALPSDEVLYDKPEKPVRGRKPKIASAEATPMVGTIEETKDIDVFSYMTSILSGDTK